MVRYYWRTALCPKPTLYSAGINRTGIAGPQLSSRVWELETGSSSTGDHSPALCIKKGFAKVPDRPGLRVAPYAGMPLGNPEFVAGLERRFDRRLTLRSPGPQPKTKAASP